MRFFYAIVALGLAAAACAGGALTFDGSYYLFKLLDTQAPFIPHQRWPAVLPQLAVLAAAQLTPNTSVLAIVFGLVYALIPLAALMLSWWMVRGTAPHLFVWPAFCICLGTTVLQLHFVSEATAAIQLFWPVLFAALTQARGARRAVAVLLALIAVSIHPFGAVLAGVAALVMGGLWWFEGSAGGGRWRWAAAFGALTAAAVLRFAVFHTAYEADQATAATFGQQFNAAISFAGAGLFFVGVAALLAFAGSIAKRERALASAIYAAECASIVAAMVCLTIWASQPIEWSAALSLKVPVLAVTILLIVLAALDYFYSRHTTLDRQLHANQDWVRRAQLAGTVFCVVLIAQSISWWTVRMQVAGAVAQSQAACIPANMITTVPGTPLDHWSIVAYSLLTQPGLPKYIITGEPADCNTENLQKGFNLTPWEFRNWADGYVNLSELQVQLLSTAAR